MTENNSQKIKNDITFTINKNKNKQTRLENVKGDEYTVVPVVMIKPLVLNGIFYPEEELIDCVDRWNGVPVSVGHPSENGVSVSARTPAIESKSNIGKVYNAEYDNGIVAELWIKNADVEFLNQNDILQQMDNNQIEVSTGLLCYIENTKGALEGVEYSKIARGIEADHLAVLPNEKGACSVADGCGTIFTNEAKKRIQICMTGKCCNTCSTEELHNIRTTLDKSNDIIRKREGVSDIFSNSVSLETVRDQLYMLLPKESWISDIGHDFIIYLIDDKLFRDGYELLSDGQIKLTGEKQEVYRVVEYRAKKINNTKRDKMQQEDDKITQLLGNVPNKEGIDALVRLPEDIKTSLLNSFQEKTEEIKRLNGQQISKEDMLMLENIKKQQEEEKNKLVDIVVNKYGAEKEEMEKLPIDTLKIFAEKTGSSSEFVGNTGSHNQNENENENENENKKSFDFFEELAKLEK